MRSISSFTYDIFYPESAQNLSPSNKIEKRFFVKGISLWKKFRQNNLITILFFLGVGVHDDHHNLTFSSLEFLPSACFIPTYTFVLNFSNNHFVFSPLISPCFRPHSIHHHAPDFLSSGVLASS